jgi:pyruvate/2-oxoacid:ferredoxin oxidoreductase alpha subunit
MSKELIKGNEAIVKAAILGGCRAFYGYPITPASEIAETAALYMPQAGGVFVQAESEVAAINMIYGAAAAGVRSMTASSGPGLSLMQEGLSYLAGSELPCVVADIMRGGPGLGNIAPEQADYHQIVKCWGARQLPYARPGARFRAGNVRPHGGRLRARRTLPQSRGPAGGWVHRADDGTRHLSRRRGSAAGS